MQANTRSLGMSAIVVAGLLVFMYWDSLATLFDHWIGSEDYSHGMFVPLISGFLIWQSRQRLLQLPREQPWWGLVVLVLGLMLHVVGELSTLYVVLHFSLWMMVVGLVITLFGIRGTKVIAFPLGYLLTAIPLPVFIYSGLSSQLQLWSSSLGVGWLQMVGVMAYREGNVIDLGPVQLQVIEACSGIRYLLPLTALALLCAYLFKDKMWKRVVLVLSSIPISIVLNGFRIGVIGMLVEFSGKGAAEGFYHLFEGWVIFMVSFGLLILEIGLLGRIGNGMPSGPFLARLSWNNPPQEIGHPLGVTVKHPSFSSLGSAYLCSVVVLVPFSLFTMVIQDREEVPSPRASFIDFPMHLNDWRGSAFALEQQYIDTLRFDDYVLADYQSGIEQPVNFYAAYYRSQKKGQSAHSPQSCLPGGGWEIASLTPTELPASSAKVQPLRANRVVIQKGDQRQIVLYWFKQRDRNLTDEYLVKWYLLWDGFFRQRTDGALVRLASLVGPGESEAAVDQRLQKFAGVVGQELTRFVPD